MCAGLVTRLVKNLDPLMIRLIQVSASISALMSVLLPPRSRYVHAQRYTLARACTRAIWLNHPPLYKQRCVSISCYSGCTQTKSISNPALLPREYKLPVHRYRIASRRCHSLLSIYMCFSMCVGEGKKIK